MKRTQRTNRTSIEERLQSTCDQAQARLERIRLSGPQDVEDLVKALNAALDEVYASHPEIDDSLLRKTQFLLAHLYDARTSGLRSENLGKVAELTDAADLEKGDVNWPMSRILRARMYRDRLASASLPMDVFIAWGLLEDAVKGLKKKNKFTRPLLAEAKLEMGKTACMLRKLPDERDALPVAEDCLNQALEIFQAEGDARGVAEVQIGLGNVHLRIYAEGKRLALNCKKALAHLALAHRAIKSRPDPILAAEIDALKSRLHILQGPAYSLEKALATSRSATVTLQHVWDREAALQGLARNGMLLYAHDRWSDAIVALKSAIAKAEEILDFAGGLSSRREAVRHLADLAAALASCQMKLGELDGAVLALERGRARLLTDSFEVPSDHETPSQDKASARLAGIVRDIRRLEAEQYGGMHDPRDYETIRQLRQERTAVARNVDIAGLAPTEAGEIIVVFHLSTQGLACFLLQAGMSTITQRDVLEIPTLTDSHVTRWLTEDGALSRSWFGSYEKRAAGPAEWRRWMSAMDSMGRRLSETFVRELASRLKALGARSVSLVPCGGLQFLPLWAAPIDDAGRCLLDEFSITIAPSAGAARLCSRRRKNRDPVLNRCFLAGVSKYEDAPALPFVKLEIEFLAGLLKAQPLLDLKVTKKAFSADAPKSTLIHLACHGTAWFSDSDHRFDWEPRPVLRLSKGGLSFRDILRTQLDHTGLVTLSACDSGAVDRSLSWDEFEGLPHVFIQAGAANVVSSLWAVDDRSTSLLMQRFYSNLKQPGESPAQALREAALWLRNATWKDLQAMPNEGRSAGRGARHLGAAGQFSVDAAPDDRPYSHPTYWAPFFVTGG